VRPLGDLADVTYGIVQPGGNVAGGIPIVRVRDLKNGRIDTRRPLRVGRDIEKACARTRLSGGEVLLSLVGSVGESAVVPASVAGWNVARAVAVVRPRSGIPAAWVRLCLSTESSRHRMATWSSTTVQTTLNLADVKRLPIALPPDPERAAITAILASLDDKMAGNERIAETAMSLAEAEFRRVPRNGTARLGEVVEFGYGKPLPAACRRHGPVAVFGSAGLAGRHDEPLVEGPGIIVGRKGTVGSVHWSEGDFFPIDTTFYVRPMRTTMEYAYFLLRDAGLDAMNDDSAVPGLNRDRALDVPVRVPATDGGFTERVRPLFGLRERMSRENDALRATRDHLLCGLMSGSVRV
jgi:type I restriction enzyme S subunit